MKRASRTRDQKHRRYYKPLERVAINEIEKYSNQFLPDTVLKKFAKVQAPGNGINDGVSKASKQIQGDANKSSLERSFLDAVLI